MRLTWLRFRREFASDWLSFQNESTFSPNAVANDNTLVAGTTPPATDSANTLTYTVGTLAALGGDDTIILGTNAQSLLSAGGLVNGGAGTDTLRLQANTTLDLTALSRTQTVAPIEQIEVVQLQGGSSLTLSANDVLSLGGAVVGSGAAAKVRLLVNATATDTVTLDKLALDGVSVGGAVGNTGLAGSWSEDSALTIGGTPYRVFNHSTTQAQVLVSGGAGITLTNAQSVSIGYADAGPATIVEEFTTLAGNTVLNTGTTVLDTNNWKISALRLDTNSAYNVFVRLNASTGVTALDDYIGIRDEYLQMGYGPWGSTTYATDYTFVSKNGPFSSISFKQAGLNYQSVNPAVIQFYDAQNNLVDNTFMYASVLGSLFTYDLGSKSATSFKIKAATGDDWFMDELTTTSAPAKLPNSSVTTDNTPVLAGTYEVPLGMGEVIKVYEGSKLLGVATVDPVTKTWTLPLVTPLSAGIHSFVAKIESASGAVIDDSASFSLTIAGGNPPEVEATASIRSVTVESVTTTTTSVFDDFSTGRDSQGTFTTPGGNLTQYFFIDELNMMNPHLDDQGTFTGTLGTDTAGFMINRENSTTTANTEVWRFTSRTVDMTRVQFSITGVDGLDRTVSYFDVDGKLLRTQSIPVNTSTQTIDSGTFTNNQAAHYFEISGGRQDFAIIQDITFHSNRVIHTVTDNSAIVSTRPSISGTLSRELLTGETVHLYNNGVDLGQVKVNGVTWTYDATIAPGSTNNFVAKVLSPTGDAYTATGRDFTVTQSVTGMTPLVLDLDGDGIETTTLAAGVVFDLDANGVAERAAWVAGGDGLLVRDLDGNGLIDSGAELFGSGTTLANGSKALDGFAALAALDSNGDGVIDAGDTAFSELQVWVDANGDAQTDAGELRSLADLSIASLGLHAQASELQNNGNAVGLLGNYITTDGAAHVLADVWLQNQALPVLDLTQVLRAAADQGEVEALSGAEGLGGVEGLGGSDPLIAMAKLSNNTPELLRLNVSDVLELPTNDSGLHVLQITGDASDVISLSNLLDDGQSTGTWAQSGTVTQNGQTFNVYQYSGDASLQVLIDQHIVQSNVHVG